MGTPVLTDDADRAHRLKTLSAHVTLATAFVMTAAKLAGWLVTGSMALMASAVDSLVDAGASFVTLRRRPLRAEAARQRASVRPRQGRGGRGLHPGDLPRRRRLRAGLPVGRAARLSRRAGLARGRRRPDRRRASWSPARWSRCRAGSCAGPARRRSPRTGRITSPTSRSTPPCWSRSA